jgi:hypothetical protein
VVAIPAMNTKALNSCKNEAIYQNTKHAVRVFRFQKDYTIPSDRRPKKWLLFSME